MVYKKIGWNSIKHFLSIINVAYCIQQSWNAACDLCWCFCLINLSNRTVTYFALSKSKQEFGLSKEFGYCVSLLLFTGITKVVSECTMHVWHISHAGVIQLVISLSYSCQHFSYQLLMNPGINLKMDYSLVHVVQIFSVSCKFIKKWFLFRMAIFLNCFQLNINATVLT